MKYSSLTRRRFLSIAAATGAALAFRPLPFATSAAQGEPRPSHVKVLVEDVGLDIDNLLPAVGPAFAVTPAGISLAAGRSSARFASPVIQADGPFTHVGLHWSATTPSGTELSFEVRTSGGGGGWTPWTALLVEASGRETPSGETFAALTDAPRHDRLQFRASFTGPAKVSPVLGAVTATLLNSKDGPPLAANAALALLDPASTDRVTYKRKDWGGDETLRTGPDGAELWPPMYVPVTKLVIHHTATTNNYQTVEDAMAEVKAIHAYHARTLGWGDIGYSVIVDKFGNSYEGRYGRTLSDGREVLSEDVVAGHALSYNYGSAGIASLGTHTSKGEGGRPGDPVTPAAIGELVRLLAWYAGQRGIDPRGSSDFLLSDDTWDRSLAHVPGHRDCNPTICPGGQLYDLLPSLRAQVAGLLGSPPVLNATADETALAGASAVEFDWESNSAEIYLTGWRKVTPQSEEIVYLSGYDGDLLPRPFEAASNRTTLGAAFVDFRNVATMEPGHYSLHLRSSAGPSFEAVRTVLVLPEGGPNSPPTVTIDAPIDGTTFSLGESVPFVATATDAEDDDLTLTGSLVWTSTLDGVIGNGGGFSTATLSEGTHVIAAVASDSGGLTGTDSVTVSIEAAPTGFVLAARAYKVKGRQFVDLSWSGADASDVNIERDRESIATVPSNDGSYTDEIGSRGGGTYTYIVCDVGAETCSNEVTVIF